MKDTHTQHESLKTRPLPRHVGIIMDGNGRWALTRNKPRYKGHTEGLEAAKRVVRTAADIGLEVLSVYAFSTENWRRTEEEVSQLMFLVQKHLKKEYAFYREHGIKIVHSGDRAGLPDAIARDLEDTVRDTRTFSGLTLNIALNYGGRDEILRGFERLRATGDATGVITADEFRGFLDHPELPDPDLIIRTGGEKRLSNFLLWQSAYAELYFSDKLWPDWDGSDLVAAIGEYQSRDRRFGSAT
ncbi:MAG TPA: di-trans,poly-cis-decaprenylcistransferase [Spirochaetia bacterium]|mgnify:CR=1 FL=1|nr:di-trans,poly-cis-decaprenylcistransferase [Spirochaetia bacterium]